MNAAALALALITALAAGAAPAIDLALASRLAPGPAVGSPPCAGDPETGDFLAALAAARGAAGRPAFEFAPVLCAVARQRAVKIGLRSPPTTELGDLPAVGADLERAGYRAFAWDLGSLSAPESGPSLLAAWRRLQPQFLTRLLASEASAAGYGRAPSPGGKGGAAIHVLIAVVPQRDVTRRRLESYRDLTAVRQEILAATNEQRAAHGLAGLRVDSRLERAAQRHAERMLAGRFYDHTDPAGRQPRDRARDEGFQAASIAENLARGLFSPREVVAHWMNSSGHRANLLAPQLSRVGIGCAYDPSGDSEDVLWVQLFADDPP